MKRVRRPGHSAASTTDQSQPSKMESDSTDFRDLPVWYEARRLTLAAYQFTARRIEQAGTTPLGTEIQDTCVTVLSAIQHLTDTRWAGSNPHKTASAALRKLATLLGRAYADGLIGTFELALVMRALSNVNDSLTSTGSGEVLCAMLTKPGLAVPFLQN